MEVKNLIKAGTVTAGTAVAEVSDLITAGTKIIINTFKANDSSSAKASCKLVWDYEGTQEILWVINEGSELPTDIEKTATGSGQKLAIVLDNGCLDDYNMSAFCEWQEG